MHKQSNTRKNQMLYPEFYAKVMQKFRSWSSSLCKKLRKLDGNVKKYKVSVIVGAFIAIIMGTGVFIYAQNHMAAKYHPLVTNQAGSHVYYISPKGADSNNGLTQNTPFKTIQKAIDLAMPGDIVELANGVYNQAILTAREGTESKPIIIHGSKNSVVKGASGQSKIIQIHHSYITLNGFSVDGKNGIGIKKSQYKDKLIYVVSTERNKGIQGLLITNMQIQNAGGECIRVRYFAKKNEIRNSHISHCGVYDFKFNDGGKNGEGIYLGTAPEQLTNGINPTPDPDKSFGNYIHHNIIETFGNECVDIKEDAHDNLVEYNLCRQQKDTESAGLDARGSNNTFRFNTVNDTVGAGVRLGGDTETDGINNNVYGNSFSNNKRGSIKIIRRPQGKICDNKTNGIEDTEVCK